MFKYKPLKDQIIEEQKTIKKLTAELSRKSADIDYIAMMCNVELESEEADEQI